MQVLPSAKPSVKQRRGRGLSRYGCRNCKLRKLKCDEGKPHCEKCRAFGVVCNFEYGVADLQPLRQSQVGQKTPGSSVVKMTLMPLRAPISSAVWSSNASRSLVLDPQDQDLFRRFQSRTIQSLGGSAMVKMCEDRILVDSFGYPFLMHGILAIAAAHDRYLQLQPTRRSLREAYHSYQCTSLFSNWLSHDIKEKDKDAIWATAVTLAILAFSSVDVSRAEEAWPLRSSDSSALEWLRLKASDQALWKLASPTRPTSAFRAMTEAFAQAHELPTSGADGIPVELAELCELDESSTQQNNPYFSFAHALSRLSGAKSETSLNSLFKVVSHNLPEFRRRLEEKDHVALLLLLMWYKRARGYKWWIDFRARYQVPAISTYLRRHAGIRTLQILLLEETG